MDEHNTYPDWDLFRHVSEVMEVGGWGHEGPFLVFRGELKMSPEATFDLIRPKAAASGLLPFLGSDAKGRYLKFATSGKKRSPSRPAIQLLLLLITVFTTLIAGTLMEGVSPGALLDRPRLLFRGVPFSFTLLIILGLHELSHYVVSRKNGIRASLPYFIPFPNILGTMGALIVSRSPFPNRKSLFDVGVAGPLASFILSVAAILVGLKEVNLIKFSPESLPPGQGIFYFGDSLLTKFLFSLRYPTIPPGYDVTLGPVAFAGWVGLFVTALNLIPMGQLDGGHISYALFGHRHALITRISMGALILVGIVFQSPLWIVIVLLITFLGRRHTPPLNDLTPLDRPRVIIAGLAFLILVLCFIPVPIQIVG
jgi:membrane-associated protease RseP (regulator of RpoE activity)